MILMIMIEYRYYTRAGRLCCFQGIFGWKLEVKLGRVFLACLHGSMFACYVCLFVCVFLAQMF